MTHQSVEQFSFSTVLVVGGTSEIALEILDQVLAKHRTLTVILAARSDDAMAAASSRLLEKGAVSVLKVNVDLANHESVSKAIAHLLLLPPPDLVIVAAGSNPQPVVDAAVILATNFTGPALMLEMYVAARPDYCLQILSLSSFAAVRPRGSNFEYGASKCALEFFLEGLSCRYRNVSITCIRLGKVNSRMSRGFGSTALDLSVPRAARLVIQSLRSNRRFVWAPRSLTAVAVLVRWLPRSVFARLDNLWSPNHS